MRALKCVFVQNVNWQSVDMGVANTTGAASTLFICASILIAREIYQTYCRHVGNGIPDSNAGSLIRPGAWYAVDISMVLNAMTRGRGATDLMRMQQCTPPIPTKKEVYAYMDSWYEAHDFSRCVLVFTFDGRRCPHKIRNTSSRDKRQAAIRARDAATTYTELEKVLRELVTIDADILYWVQQWIKDSHYDKKVLTFGAPFEADAQMVRLEQEGIVDGIVTDDVDAWFLGGNNIIKGFTTRKRGGYSAILGGMVRARAHTRTKHPRVDTDTPSTPPTPIV